MMDEERIRDVLQRQADRLPTPVGMWERIEAELDAPWPRRRLIIPMLRALRSRNSSAAPSTASGARGKTVAAQRGKWHLGIPQHKAWRYVGGALATLILVAAFALAFSFAFGGLLSRTAAPVITFPKIDRHPAPANYDRGTLQSVPTYDPNSDESWQMDLRSYDLSQFDLSHSLNDLMYAYFDSQTKWPSADKMPPGFDWQQILELGKDPGLGIRELHAEGVTGKGVGIAIISQPLLVDHEEYADRLMLYEEIDIRPMVVQTGTERAVFGLDAQMVGTAGASIAVGHTVGVAPGADLYYIGAPSADWAADGKSFTYNFTYYAKAVRRILEINRSLPEDRKIRVIAMQVGWSPGQEGYAEITAAVNEAKKAGLLVVSSSLSQVHGFNFQGLGRSPLADPNSFEAYEPGRFWATAFYGGQRLTNTLLVPMDSRTTASPTGADDYVFYRGGGWSWATPYLAGMYALAVQVDPTVTPEVFWSLALKTGRTIQVNHDGKAMALGQILDPAALVAVLRGGPLPIRTATPVPSSSSVPSSSLLPLLSLLPDTADYRSAVAFTDYAKENRLLKLKPPLTGAPISDTIAYVNVLQAVGVPASVSEYLPGWETLWGYNMVSATQQVSAPGWGTNAITAVRGPFDEGKVSSALQALGFQGRSYLEVPIWSFSGGAMAIPDLAPFPEDKRQLSFVNGLLVTSGKPEQLNAAIDTAKKHGRSLAENQDLAALAGVVEKMNVYSGVLSGQPRNVAEVVRELSLDESQKGELARWPLKAPRAWAVGVGLEGERLYVYLFMLYPDDATAAAAAPNLLGRLQNGTDFTTRRPWKEAFPAASVAVDGRIVRAWLEIQQVRTWTDLIYTRSIDGLLAGE